MIVFGWNSFDLTSFKPSSVGMPVEMDVHTIVRRQKYFHLFWIPFFPIGQVWIVKKKGDSESYVPTAEVSRHLDSLQLKYKTPWYSYAILLMILTLGFITLVVTQVDSYQRNEFRKAELKRNNEELLSLVEKGKPNTYFTFKDTNYKSLYLKVLSSDATTLTCVVSQSEKCSDYRYCLLEAFITNDPENVISLDTVKVSKTDLIRTYNANNVTPFEAKSILPNYAAVYLETFKVIDYPVFLFEGASYKDGKYGCSFKNIGAPAKQLKFETREHENNCLQLDTAAMATLVNHSDKLVLIGTYTDVEPFLTANVFLVKENNAADTCKLFVTGVSASVGRPND